MCGTTPKACTGEDPAAALSLLAVRLLLSVSHDLQQE